MPSPSGEWIVYILRCADGTLYTGLVIPAPTQQPAWVALMDLYEGRIYEQTQVDSSGKFKFSQFHMGRFVLVLNIREQVASVQYIELREDTVYPLRISVSRGR